MKDILAEIVRLRMACGWTEYQLAEYSDLPQSTISSWYRKNVIPSVASLDKICTAFGITLSQLFAEEEIEMTPRLKELIDTWKTLSLEQQEAVLTLLKLQQEAVLTLLKLM